VAYEMHPIFTASDEPACRACGYALGGLPDHGNCPECGAAYDPATRGAKLNPPTLRHAIGFAIKPFAIGICAALLFLLLAFLQATLQNIGQEVVFLLFGTAVFSLGLGACWTGLRSIVLLRAIARFAERRSEQSALPPLFGFAGTLVLGAFALAGALLTALMVAVFVASFISSGR